MNEVANSDLDLFRTIDRATWKKYLFYVDIMVWGIFAISTAFTISNIYVAGWNRGAEDLGASTGAWWNTLVSLSFMVATLAWIFFRFWKNAFLATRRPF